ncbi:MAG: hypothetical protein UZ20_WS6002001130 [candidate division WS6 bacterium OLB21]|uniref:DUF4832 domain-containing protein n=2 Tax=Candidatus Dojkabacteria TaxID=74243 RepID=A0A136KEG9_9BACT|nr:MAG: hypothetical protein UZ20_WS6002001130 [candidate division WS6 bacterium OLB21]
MKRSKLIASTLLMGSFLAAATLVAVLLSSTSTNFENNFASASQTNFTIQRNNSYLANPGIGWQYMGSSDKTILPETVAYPDRHLISWRIINPQEGVYDFSTIDSFLSQAIANNKQLSFRVYTMRGEGYGGHQMPTWVVNKGIPLVGSGSEAGQPDYSNCNYQFYWAQMVEALRQKYDGNPNIAYIDISGYGNFNEWSYHDGITEFEPNPFSPQTPDGYARNRLVDMFVGGSSNNHLCRQNNGTTTRVSYNYQGFQSTQLIMPWAGIRHSVKYAFEKSATVGFRHDCLGRSSLSDFSQPEITEAFGSRWTTAPIVYELCAINWNNSTFQKNVSDVMSFSHASLIHDNPNGTAQPKETISNLMKPAGYRYTLASGSYPSQADAGSTITINTSWQNIGLAPNYPRMGQNFRAYIGLKNLAGSVILQSAFNSQVSTWMPADTYGQNPPVNNANQSITIPADFNSGIYKLVVFIKDERTGRNIQLDLTNGDSNNYYEVGQITVNSTTPTPSPTLTPTATVTTSPSPTIVTPSPTQNPRPSQNPALTSPTPTFSIIETIQPTIINSIQVTQAQEPNKPSTTVIIQEAAQEQELPSLVVDTPTGNVDEDPVDANVIDIQKTVIDNPYLPLTGLILVGVLMIIGGFLLKRT